MLAPAGEVGVGAFQDQGLCYDEKQWRLGEGAVAFERWPVRPEKLIFHDRLHPLWQKAVAQANKAPVEEGKLMKKIPLCRDGGRQQDVMSSLVQGLRQDRKQRQELESLVSDPGWQDTGFGPERDGMFAGIALGLLLMQSANGTVELHNQISTALNLLPEAAVKKALPEFTQAMEKSDPRDVGIATRSIAKTISKPLREEMITVTMPPLCDVLCSGIKLGEPMEGAREVNVPVICMHAVTALIEGLSVGAGECTPSFVRSVSQVLVNESSTRDGMNAAALLLVNIVDTGVSEASVKAKGMMSLVSSSIRSQQLSVCTRPFLHERLFCHHIFWCGYVFQCPQKSAEEVQPCFVPLFHTSILR